MFHFDAGHLDLTLLAKLYLASQTSEHNFISGSYLRKYLSIFRYLSMLSAARAILRRLAAWLEGSELVRMWKEPVVI